MTIRNFLACFLVAALGWQGPAFAQAPDDLAMTKIAPDLLAAIEARHATKERSTTQPTAPVYRIVVDLVPIETAEDRTRAFASKSAHRALQTNIATVQDRVFRSMSKAGSTSTFEPWNRYRSTYGFSAFADADAVFRLAARDDVEAIYEMPVYAKADPQAHALTNTDNVHASEYRGLGTTIAVIDDGIDHDHAAFGGQAAWPNNKILGGFDFADNDANPRIDCGAATHGTSVAGVAAGNGGGILGAAPDANLVMLKVQSAALCGTRGLDGDLIGAIDWVVTNRDNFDPPIRILSMSLGYLRQDRTAFPDACPGIAENNALTAARNAGLVVLAASGNDAFANGIAAPACHPDVVSVGAVYDADVGQRIYQTINQNWQIVELCRDNNTSADQITCYSNSDTFLDLLGPSECAQTATNNCFGGTSAATPYVAGVAALLYGKNPRTTRNSVAFALDWGGVSITDARNGVTARRVDANGALATIGGMYMKYPSPRVNGQLVGARGIHFSGGSSWPLSTPAETARRFCEDRGLPRHQTYQSSVRGSTYSYINGQDGNGPWSVTGNSDVTMLDRIDCRVTHDIETTHYSNPTINGYRVGRSTTSSISREETAKQFCIAQGHEPGYISWNITYPTGTAYSYWTGSSWSVTGNSSVELYTWIQCADIP